MGAGLIARLRNSGSASGAALRAALIVAGIMFVLLALVAVEFVAWYRGQVIVVMRSQVTGLLSPYSSELKAAFHQRAQLVEGLVVFALAQPDDSIDSAVFEAYAASLLGMVPDARALTIAPDGIERYVYPPDTSEAVPGRDLLHDASPQVQADVQYAIASGELVASSPYPLSQGERGLVLRQPILRDGEFWGLATLTLDLDELLASSGLADPPASVRLALVDTQDQTIFGDDGVRAMDPVIHTVTLANLTWRLEAVISDGWEAIAGPSVDLVRATLLGVVGLIALAIFMVVLRQNQLRKAVEQRGGEVLRVNNLLRRDMERLQQIEAALQASEARFRGAFTFASMGMALTDMSGGFMQVNDTLCRLLEYEADELIGKKIWDIAHPSDREACHLMWQGVLDGQRTRAQFELYTITKSGNPLWAKIGLSLVRDEQDAPQYFIYQFDDRTQHKHMEEALWQQILRNELILQAASDGFCMINEQGIIQEVNPAFAAITGYRQEELLDRELRQLEAGEMPDRIDVYMAQALQHQASRFETSWRRKDGQVARLAGSISLVEMDRTRFFFISVQDVTEQRRNEQALREKEAQLRQIVDLVPHMIFVKDREGRFILANRALATAYGTTVEELTGHLEAEFSSHQDEMDGFQVDDRRVIDTGETVVRPDEIFTDAEGQTHILHTTKIPYQAAGVSGPVVLGVTVDITDSVRAEHALRRSEERYRSLFEDVPIALWEEDFSAIKRYLDGLVAQGVADVDAYLDAHPEVLEQCADLLEVRGMNRATLDLYGWNDPQSLTAQIRSALREDTAGPWREELRAFLRGNLEYHTETLIETGSGEVRDVSMRISIPPDHKDTWDRVLVSMNDITERKRAEAAERELRTLAEALRDTAAALVSTLDWDAIPDRILEYVGRVVPHDAANIALLSGDSVVISHLRGYDPELVGKLRGMPMPIQIPNYWGMLSTGKPCLIPDTRHNPDWQEWPETKWVRSYVSTPLRAHGQVIGFLNLDSHTPNFFDEGDVERLQVFADQAAIAVENAQLYDQIRRHAADMETRVAERTLELETERAQLQAILDSVGEGVVYTEDYALRYANWRVGEMLGYTMSELTGHLPGIALPDSLLVGGDLAPRIEEILQSLNETRLWHGDVKVRRKDGSQMQASLIVTLVSQAETQPVRAVTLIRDVSRERALQAQKDRFIANASHELRTPLANMKMRLYLLRRQPDRFEEHMEVLKLVTDRMELLVDELLDKSRFERGVISLHREPVDLRDLLLSAIEVQQPMAEEQGLMLVSHLPAEQVVAIVDRGRISQVVTNLISNAINYTSGGGTITIDLESRDGQAWIHVRDTGIGIPLEMQTQIFEPFFRVNEAVARGTGLGLTISREIVRMHRGDIIVHSAAGEGSTFTVQLPLAPPGTGPLKGKD